MNIESLTSDLWLKIDQLHMGYLQSDDIYDKLHKRKKLEGLVADYLSIVPQDRKFVSTATWDIISNSAKRKPDFSLLEAADAFHVIEQIAANLINDPWRKKLWSISQYSGFYKHRVETALFGAEKMFMDMGYSPSPGQAQVLSLAPRVGEHPVNIDMVTSVARDCLLALVECHILAEVYNTVSAQFPTVLEEVINFRRDHIGSIDTCIRELLNVKHGEAIRAKEISKIKKKLQGPKDKYLLGKFLKESIQMKQSEIKCPVCLEEAGVPIYRCVNEHLICGSCRTRVGLTCPVCRVRYQGPPKRYIYAERTVEEIQRLREQLAEIE